VNTINIYITLIKDSDNKRRVFKVARNIIKFLKNHSSLKTIVKIEFKPSNDESSDDDDKSSDKMMIDS
jgi:hypothetical protein